MDEEYAVDVDLEISTLTLVIEDIERDSRFGLVGATICLVGLIGFGPSLIGRVETYIVVAALFVLLGVKDHLWRMRTRQARDQIVSLKLWASAELQSGRRAMRVIHAIDERAVASNAGKP